MSQIKNPFDSLQNYFDELLLTEELDSFEPVDSQTSRAEQRIETVSEINKTVVEKQLQSKPSITIPHFADPEILQKEKLQKLLSRAPPGIKIAPAVKAVPVKALIDDPTEIQEWVVETAEPVVDTIVVSQAEEIVSAFKIPGLDWLPNGLPQWAQARFDVLLFKVSGLTLAVPLISLGQIQPITEELTPLFGQADWFMGLQPTPAGKIRIVNTAKFVMPERHDENFVKNAKYVVSINGVPWGLAVDSVNQPISLQPDDVKWRTNRSKRPWLAGTVKEHMCALLDIPMIGQMLMDADKNAMKSRW